MGKACVSNPNYSEEKEIPKVMGEEKARTQQVLNLTPPKWLMYPVGGSPCNYTHKSPSKLSSNAYMSHDYVDLASHKGNTQH